LTFELVEFSTPVKKVVPMKLLKTRQSTDLTFSILRKPFSFVEGSPPTPFSVLSLRICLW
jgi:hypothetical protein